MLALVLAEAALEFVPRAIYAHPAVANHAHRVGLEPQDLFLDRSYHHAAMHRLPHAEKRGRPDLVHFGLLAAIDTPLCRLGGLHVYLHTRENRVIEFAPAVRLPRTYFRFEGLLRQALKGRGGVRESQPLLQVRAGGVQSILGALGAQMVVGLSTLGKPSSAAEVANRLVAHPSSAVVVGGFPHGHFSHAVERACDQLLWIHPQGLETHVVVARVLYEVEQRLGPSGEFGARKPPPDVVKQPG
jgi:rRNA small subunit pseudouridine methyltransferase Nep1